MQLLALHKCLLREHDASSTSSHGDVTGCQKLIVHTDCCKGDFYCEKSRMRRSMLTDVHVVCLLDIKSDLDCEVPLLKYGNKIFANFNAHDVAVILFGLKQLQLYFPTMDSKEGTTEFSLKDWANTVLMVVSSNSKPEKVWAY